MKQTRTVWNVSNLCNGSVVPVFQHIISTVNGTSYKLREISEIQYANIGNTYFLV